MTRALVCGVLALLACLAIRIAAPDDMDALDQAKQGLYVVDAYHEGRWLVPMEAGSIYPTKPPLMTWLSLLVAAPRGRVDELACRWPSVAAVFFLLGGTVHFARRLGPTAALVGAVAVAANFHITNVAWLARTDMLLAAATTFAVAQALECFLVARSGRDPRRSFLALAALAGFGTVCKSPVALACPAFALGFFLVAMGELGAFARAVGWKTAALGALVYALIVGAWLVPAALVAGEPFVLTLWNELVGHVAAVGEYAAKDKIKPFWYPIAHFMGEWQPWSSLLVLGALGITSLERPKDERGLAEWFVACAVLGCMTFFALMKIKRADHVVPVYPWAALAVGVVVERGGRLVRSGFGALALAAMAASALLPLALRDRLLPLVDFAKHPLVLLAAAFVLAPAGVLVLAGVLRQRVGPMLAGTALTVVAGLGVYYLALDKAVTDQKARTVPLFCDAARPLVGREPLVLYRVPPSVAFYFERSQESLVDFDDARAEMRTRGARAVVTDVVGAAQMLAVDPGLAVAATSGFYSKAGQTWQLALLLPKERVKESPDPTGGAARVWW